MATEEKILLDVQLKTGDALKRVAEIGLETDKLKKQQRQLKEEYDSGKISQDQYTTGVAKLTSETRSLALEKSGLDRQVKNEIKTITAAKGSYDQLSAQYGLNKQALNDMSAAMRFGTEEGQKLEKETYEIYQEMKKLQEATGVTSLSVGDYEDSIRRALAALTQENEEILQHNKILEQGRIKVEGFGNANDKTKAELTQINSQLGANNQKYAENQKIIQKVTSEMGFLATKEEKLGSTMTNTGNTIAGMKNRLAELDKILQTTDVGSKEFEQANKEAQKLRLTIDQTLGKVNEFGDKEPKNPTKKAFGDATEAAAGLVSMIQLANIVGGEQGTIAEVQAKAMKALAISQLAVNSAKSIAAIMDVKDLVVKGLQTLSVKELTIAQAAQEAGTGKLSIAQKLFTAVVGKSTGGMKAFRIALAGTGIGAIVILLAELIFNFKEVSKWVERFTNGIKDWTAEISGGNKAVAQLVNIITTIGSPLMFVIKLINDFSGTLSSLQGSVNGLVDNLTSRMGKLGDIIKVGLVPFNLFINALKSLDKENKNNKIDIEQVTKLYENQNAVIEQTIKKKQQQIDIARAQGKSERDLNKLTREMLQQTSKDRQAELDFAIKIMKAKGKTYQTLSEQERKLYDEVSNAHADAVVEQTIFEAEITKAANDAAKERYKERIELERSLQHELISLRNGFIKNEFDRQRADLEEQRRIDQEANDLLIKENIKKFGEKSQIVSDLREKEKLQVEKFNDDMFAIDVAQADKAIDLLDKKNETEAQIRRESFVQQVQDLQTQSNIEKDLANASFVNTGKTLDQRKNQQIQHNNDLLSIEMKFLQEKLKLAEQFASKDGIISPEEVEQINELATAIAGVQEKIKQGENAKVIDGLGLTPKDLQAIEQAADAVLSILESIKSVIDANAANQIRAIDDAFKYEEAAIQHSTASQEEKEEKIQALNKKTAEKKYKIELEQFEANKALSIITATINTALAVMNAIASVPFPANIAAAILAGATGAVQIGIIASQPAPPKPQFFDGGFTESSGNPRLKSKFSNSSRDLHHEEYVAPAKVLRRKEALPHIAALEAMRMNIPGKLNIGGYADGGLVNRSINNDVNAAINTQLIADAMVKSISRLKVVTKVTDINNVQGEVLSNRVTSRI